MGRSPPGANGVTPGVFRSAAYSAAGVFTMSDEFHTMANVDLPMRNPQPLKTPRWRTPRSPITRSVSATRLTSPESGGMISE